ncbi:transcriptional repressor [Streptomyces sp. NPDC007206]|uniref:transcriptional repressor n=1 Tax=Streptomyces sp. NPDC007206 TaxID=3154317 RepID=UPI0033CD32E1
MASDRQHAPTPSPDVILIGRLTRQRTVVVDAFIRAQGFVGARALHDRLAADGSPVGLSTVYRTLTALAAAGRGRHGPRHQR